MSEFQRLIRGVPALSSLGDQTLAALESAAEVVAFSEGETLTREDDQGDHAFLILSGSAAVTAAGADGPVPLATLGVGELVGELALFSESQKRSATVTASSPLRAYRLDGSAFRRLVLEHSEARTQFEAAAKLLARARFIKLAASPFSQLDSERAKQLASRLQELQVPAGETIVRQGDEGDRCFLIQSGEVEVFIASESGEPRRVTGLGPGSMFGESSLLTASPRNSTIVAAAPCSLFVLMRQDLVEVMSQDVEVGTQFREMLRLRARPTQAPGVIEVQNSSRSGEPIIILKDPARRAYYRLSAQGHFVWRRLDGQRTIKDLTMDYFREFKAFAPQAVIETVRGLSESGFAVTPGLRADVAQAAAQRGRVARLLSTVRSILHWQITLRNVDAPIGWVYDHFFRLFFTRPAQILLAIMALIGVFFFVRDIRTASAALNAYGPWILAWMFAMQSVALFVHEAGHALATKAIGREVHGVGVGWYWFGIIAFVDTTDTWLATRMQRIGVSFAGPYINLLLGSALAILGHFQSHELLHALLWQFALVSYTGFLINFNPMLEYDGYYILTDWLDRPNFRKQALGWIGGELRTSLRDNRAAVRAHWRELAFGIGSILYVFVMGGVMLFYFRFLFAGWLSHLITARWASAMAWGIVLVVISASLIDLAADLRGRHTRTA